MEVTASEVTSEVTEQECIRLPCSHIIDKPSKSSVHLVCPSCNRNWHVYTKGVEICAREE